MYGIDFGTSNTVVTVRDGGAVKVLDLGEGGVVPSLLYFERDRRPSVGAEAMTEYTAALSRYKTSGNLYSRFRFFQGLKLALKDERFEGTHIFGRFWTAESLVALFLREVKRRADEATGTECLELVAGRPVVLSSDPEADRRLQERFRSACILAGFRTVEFVLEPVAASVSLLDGTGGLVLVFDFGGGTLDITVARVSGSSIEPLASVGADLGGYLLNEDISRARIIRHFGFGGKLRTMTGNVLEMPNWITAQVASFYALPLADISNTREVVKGLVFDALPKDKEKLRGLDEFLDRNLSFDLFREIDGAKIALSSADSATILYTVPPYVLFRETMTRIEFEDLIAPRIEAAKALVTKALLQAGVEAAEVTRVVRVGGSSKVPAFARMLEGMFPGRVEEGEVFTSIAAGLLEARERGLVV
jgi:hypothetical chaperone protein